MLVLTMLTAVLVCVSVDHVDSSVGVCVSVNSVDSSVGMC